MTDKRTAPLPTDAALVNINNVFEAILSGALPASFVYKDDQVAAFMDIQPVNSGHVLVVPLAPARFLGELDDSTAAHMFVIAKRIAAAIRQSGLACEGVNMFLADGAAAGQEVPHLHLHVFPRFREDGFGLKYGERNFVHRERAELDEAAERIRSALTRA